VSSAPESEGVRRLRWRCRRGLLELDLLFDRFLGVGYTTLEPEERAIFEELTEEHDSSILAWLESAETAPERYRNIIKKIL
jgi:antitoxin CptB